MIDERTLAVKIAYSDLLAAEESLALIEERKKEAENRVRAARRAFLSLLNANHEGKKWWPSNTSVSIQRFKPTLLAVPPQGYSFSLGSYRQPLSINSTPARSKARWMASLVACIGSDYVDLHRHMNPYRAIEDMLVDFATRDFKEQYQRFQRITGGAHV